MTKEKPLEPDAIWDRHGRLVYLKVGSDMRDLWMSDWRETRTVGGGRNFGKTEAMGQRIIGLDLGLTPGVCIIFPSRR